MNYVVPFGTSRQDYLKTALCVEQFCSEQGGWTENLLRL
jgi:hypothetical protein